MKRTVIVASMIVMTFFCLYPLVLCGAGADPTEEIRSAAAEGIGMFLQNASGKRLERVGFQSEQEAGMARVGKGFRVYTVPPQGLLAETISADLYSLAIATDIWQFLVMAERGAVAVLTVEHRKRKWAPVSIGAAGLAKQLDEVVQVWPESLGYHQRLIRIYQASSDFVAISRNENLIGFIPLVSARVAIGARHTEFDPSDIHESKEILSKLKAAVTRNLGRTN